MPSMFKIVRYTAERADEWNQFVAKSKQGTFLHNRRYMDYHSNRFQDHSLLVYRKGKLFALLPANEVGDTLWSHQGLTYGGLLTDANAVSETVCDTFMEINNYLRSVGFRRVVYKPVSYIYHRMPAEEDLYALFLRCQARLVERDVSSAIYMNTRPRFAESRRSGLRKAQTSGISVGLSTDIDSFWKILSDNLAAKYNARPVHSLTEMELLASRFPDNIQLYMAYDCQGVPIGGTLLYLTQQVVRTQYISASPEGKRVGALDLLFYHLLNEVHFSQPYFDFGTSAQADSNEVNAQLIFQKQGFGARAICYDTYEWTL